MEAAFVTILFTDLGGSTELFAHHIDDAADAIRREHFSALRRAVAEHGGREVKSTGDGLMVEFVSTVAAVRCAIDLQRATKAAPAGLGLRVGLDAGEPIREGDDLYGTPVIVASRLCDAAAAGEILASGVVGAVAGPRVKDAIEPTGEMRLKGLDGPIPVARVRWDENAPAKPPPAPAPPAPAGVASQPLVERTGELAQLDAALDAARSGTGVTVLVEGPAGIGKTSLLAYAAQAAAASGLTALRGRGSQLERDYALGVARQCFEPELRRGPDAEGLLAGAAELGARAVLDVPDAAEAAPAGVLHGLYWLTANLADRAPVLLVVDDAHWADEPSLLFVAYLARRVESLPVALVIGTREAEDPDTAAVLEEIRREPATRQLELAPLATAGVEELLGALGRGRVEREFAEACQHATGGNPFLLGELVRALRADDVAFTAAHADR